MQKDRTPTTKGRRTLLILILMGLVFLTACGDFSPIDENTRGFFNRFFVLPFSMLIKGLASLFNGSYGLSIIVITIVIRLVILPFMVKQQRQNKDMQEKMAYIQPEMQVIQEKYKGKRDLESQQAMQKEMAELYQKHDFQPGQMFLGCLPLFLQMPILIGFFYAIRRTPEIADASFLWFSLGETDIWLVLLAALVYFLQARVSLIGVEKSQQQMMAIMAYASPIMIGVISLTMPAALPLYWVVSGIFMTVQTYVLKKLILHK